MSEGKCFWDDNLSLVHVEGVSLCADHAKCAGCGKFVTSLALTCRCDKYGAYGHTENVYCSEECLEGSHWQGDLVEQEQEEDAG